MLSNDSIHLVTVIGRVLLASVFIYGAFRRHFSLHPIAVKMLTKRRLPYPEPLLHTATLYQIIAGVLLAVGQWPLPVAISLIAFTLVASVLMLDFWNKQGPERIAAESGWQSNMGIIGGLLFVAVSAA